MNRRKAFSFTCMLAAFALSSCSGLPKSQGGGGGGSATVSFTLVADTLPTNPSIISFKVSVNKITLTPTTGTAQTLTPANAVIDLMRLQSDTAFLGSIPKVPTGTYTVQVSFGSPEIAFFNDTGSAMITPPCAINAVCTATLTATGSPTIASFTVTVAANANQGIELDFNLANAISLSNGTLTVNFTPSAPSAGVLTAFTLPRQNANLSSGQLELIEDFTGVVSLSGNNVTVTSPTRGTLTALESSSSFFDASPDSTMCVPPTTFANCVKPGQIASVDVLLNLDGSIALKEFEPLVSTQQDLVEGIVYTVSGTIQQFGIVVTDKTQAATSSLIGTVNAGDLLTVNLATSPPLQPFFVDQKGLSVSTTGEIGLFSGQTSVSAIRQGQTVSVHATSFTAASGTTPASVTVDTVTLRWSRLTASVQSDSGNTLINLTLLPTYFGASSGSLFSTQVFSGNPGADGVTNVDGIPNSGLPTPGLPAELRVLYLENATNSATFPFMAAKVRQH